MSARDVPADAPAGAIALGLTAKGVGIGDRVALRFGRAQWAEFAAAYVGVRTAGAVAVLISPGATSLDAERAVAHSGATGLLHGHGLGLPSRGWQATPGEIGAGQDAGEPVVRPLDWSVRSGHAGREPDDDLLYPAAPLALGPVRVRAAGVAGVAARGVLVHAWSPGSVGGHHALGVMLVGGFGSAVSLPTFDPDELCTLVAAHSAAAVGLTPALAAALVASDAPRRHDLASVTQVLLSGRPSAGLHAALAAAFSGAHVVQLDVPVPVELAGTAPAAISQLGMLWHEQFAPGSFNLPCLVRRYEGPLNVAALRWALTELMRRHEPLRSTFHVADGQVHQAVGGPDGLALEVVDLEGLNPPERDAAVARLLRDASSRPFDLVRGPLFEPRIVRLGPDDHLLVVRLHHTVFDDWSVDVFRRELSALYRSGCAAEEAPPPAPATTFTTFARRQHERLAGEAGEAEHTWWRNELRRGPLSVQLPLGRGPAGGPVRRELPPALAAGLRALSPRLRATPFMTALAAFAVVLHRMTGQDDLLIATVVAHRNRTELEPLIGCFTKKVPLRLRLDGDPTFPELVVRTRASLLGALAHQDLAFDEAVQAGVGAAAARHGVVPQVAVVFQGETPQVARLDMPGVKIGPFEVPVESRQERHFSAGADDEDRAQWGDGIYLGSFLILSLLDTADGIAFIARGVFDRPEVGHLLDGFEALLTDIVAAPDRPISTLAGDIPMTEPTDDQLMFRGFRIDRRRLEAALAACPGVEEVTVAEDEGPDGEPSLVAHVVPTSGRRDPNAVAAARPSPRHLREAVWREWPGAPWPVATGAPPDPDPVAVMLAAMWEEVAGRPVATGENYWQDFSFLEVLAGAREAGIDLSDEHVVRGRTLEMLAAAARL